MTDKSPVPIRRFSQLSAPRQAFVRLCQSINFGEIRGLVVQDSEPMFNPSPTVLIDLLLEVARKHPDVLADPPPEALLAELTQSSLNFSLRFWTVIRGDDNYRLKSDLRFLVLGSLQKHGIVTGASSSSVADASAA